MVGIPGEQVAQPGTDDRGVVGDAVEGLARGQAYGPRTGTASGPSRRVELPPTSRSETRLDLGRAGRASSARSRSTAWRPGPQREPVADRRRGRPSTAACRRSRVDWRGAGRDPGRSFTTRRARSPIRSSSPSTRSTDTTKRRSDATGRLAGQQVVAALGERHVHGVDVVVGVRRPASATSGSPWSEHLAHALEVLVDPHRHQLDLQPELVELGWKAETAPASTVGRRHVSRTGR